MPTSQYLSKDEISSIHWYIANTLLSYEEIADVHGRTTPTILRVKNLFLTALASRFRTALVSYNANKAKRKVGPILTRSGYYRSHTPSWWTGTECAPNYVFSHVLVCCKKHGLTYLPKGMCVHHINGIRTDNRWYNLQLMTKKEHVRLHNLARDSYLCLKRAT